MNDNKKLINELIIGSIEGTITEEQFALLKQILRDDDEAARYYVEISSVISQFRRSEFKPEIFDDNELEKSYQNISFDSDLWKSLAENEIQAPKVENKNTNKLIEKVIYQENPRQISRFSLYSLIISVAALLLLIIYVVSNPVIPERKVATLLDSINAQWAGTSSLPNGTRLSTSQGSVVLSKGIAKLLFDNNTKIVFEAPAEFELLTDDRIALHYGRLCATVPHQALGFTVTTANSKIIDLGTEFGVYTDRTNETQLHVFRGKTKLISGMNNNVNDAMDVLGGFAKKVITGGQKIQSVQLSEGTFARDINSQTREVWRGEILDLADIAGGGNGLESGQNIGGIDWNGRQFTSGQTLILDQRQKAGSLIPVEDNPFVDCLFVPSGIGQTYVTMTSNTTELNLDDFIRRDTNGLITLMLTYDLSDSDNHYWFSSKETEDPTPDMLPALIFPRPGGEPSRIVTTEENKGADTYLSNDSWQSSDSVHGTESIIMVRNFREQRIEIAMLRFDVSDVTNNRTGAMLRLHLSKGTRLRNLHVYGLNDGPADNWDENTVCYNTAPGLKPAVSGDYQLNMDQVESLGTFPVTDISIRITRDRLTKWATPDFAKLASYTNPMSGYPVTCSGTISRQQNGIWQDNTLMMSNIRCGTSDNPSILLAANAGITFDLDAIRAKHSTMKITAFSVTCGLARAVSLSPASAQNTAIGKANMYILVNGNEKFSTIDKTQADEPQSVRIDLAGNDKYLTLISTQGSDGGNQNDLCVFLKPTLFLEP